MNSQIIILIFIAKFMLLAVLSAGFVILLAMLLLYSPFTTIEQILFELERMQKLLNRVINF